MIDRLVVKILPLLLCGSLVSPLYSADLASPVPANAPTNATAGESLNPTPVFRPVHPGPLDGQIAFVTAKMLEKYHYTHQPFNGTVSSKFLDRYLETFDPMHMHFTQGDLADFELYRTNLDRLTLTQRGVADTTPACEIFNRFVKRLQQRVDYLDDLLKHETFTFDTDERAVLNRKDLPYPADLDEAKKLWLERLRFEYLQEKLGKLDAKKKAVAAPKTEPGDEGTTNSPPAQTAPERKKTDAEEIVDTLSHRYHRYLRTFLEWDNDDVLQYYLNALAHVYDPHSDYLGKASFDSFSIGMNLSLFGIGAELTTEDGYCTIRRLLPGGPAAKSKRIKENDRIVAVAQSNQPPVDVVNMSLNKAVQLIRGPKGTEVRLTIIPAGADSGARRNLTLIRDEVKIEDQEAKAKVIEYPNPRGETVRLGVIDLPSFYAPFDLSNTRSRAEARSTSADVERLVRKLMQENVRGIILDLRHNGGGSLEEAVRLTGLFIKQGPVVQVREYNGDIQQESDDNPAILYDGPLIVLTSRLSASASEILAGALQDYGRALIVGDASTHGKGTVQSVNALKPFIRMGGSGVTNDPGALKLTIKKFYRASGASTQLNGVNPDIVLPSLLSESKDFGETSLENALPWDTIDSAKYDHLNMVDPVLPELKKRSTARVASDKDYAYIREDIEFLKKQQADKSVSLNEKLRLKEKEEADARYKARDKERASRPERPEVVYDFTLKQALLPGLPPPTVKTNAAVAKIGQHPAGASTNAPIASVGNAVESNGFDSLDEEKPTAVDPPLTEAERILLDYVSLSRRGDVAATQRVP